MSCTAYKAVEQPPIWEHKATDNVFIKQLLVKDVGSVVPQHSHKYSHTTLLCVGSVQVWANGTDLGAFTAPAAIPIPAYVKHTFITLEPNTLMYCIHNVDRTGEVELHEFNEVL